MLLQLRGCLWIPTDILLAIRHTSLRKKLLRHLAVRSGRRRINGHWHSAPSPERSILETHFDGGGCCSDWERIHALIDPACAGLPRLIRKYNASFLRGSAASLEDPDDTLAIPCFAL
jgi:hypothetical protein